jgi:hypothetical protein
MTKTSRPATAAEIAADAHKPAHRQVTTVEENTDGRATVGRAKTIHRAHVTTYLNHRDESIGSIVTVGCGAERYRNNRSAATATSTRYAVDCTRCLAA